MKNSIIIFLSVLAISLAFSGCGESEGSVSATNSGGSPVVVGDADEGAGTSLTDVGDTTVTVAKTPLGLSTALGTPPSI